MAEKESIKSINPLNNWISVLMLTFFLGLAPFFPEPHIWGKLKWVAGGAVGMKLMDWGDLLFHGFPWILLIRLSIIQLKSKFKAAKV
ncbi:hypothetical protein [Algoriphagus hitonicola]|uniref:RND transporter n=1 Tax=Algoriphagus hitonicola TaxID=435880 RepID=A0A1I2XF59_9BACT|nr:hypothetical protein [Algoriphagus hitonicola]SFH12128.1 hypothetical protein SAMN04487988_11853 [Algoriphagus hitonicola]